MLRYPLALQKDGEYIMATSPDFPELTTFGVDREEALARATDALEEAIAARIHDNRDIPSPSDGEETVVLPTLSAIKVLLYRGLREQEIGKAELARRLGWYLPQVDRVLDLSHSSRMDQMDAAMNAIGCHLLTKARKHSSGGAAAAGGSLFQATVCAISYIHTLKGTPINWIEDCTGSPPIAVSSETGGPGDDVRLELADGSIVEIQAKKGLKADKRFWTSFDSLCDGISLDRCTYAVLAVCPSSSNTIRQSFAEGIRRIGQHRFDGLSSNQQEVLNRLRNKGYDPASVCARLRIRTVSALSDQIDDIVTARALLEHLCDNRSQIKSAWDALLGDAIQTMANKGRRTCSDLVSVLQSSNIAIKTVKNESPAAISLSLRKWIASTTNEFHAFGIQRPLVTDVSWIKLHVSLCESVVEETSMVKALCNYHELTENPTQSGDETFDAETIGTFHKHCVIIGGPGSGKSLLLHVLAREFAKDSYVSLKVDLRLLAKQINERGFTIDEGLLRLGLDGSGVSPQQFRSSTVSELVFLCDGLDECGNYQKEIAAGLKKIAASSKTCRIIVTTRPIGYETSELRDWRHYVIRPLNPDKAVENSQVFLKDLPDTASITEDKLHSNIKAIRGQDHIVTTPLLLSYAAALILNGVSLGKSKIDLYNGILRNLINQPASRKNTAPDVQQSIRDYVLNFIGWITNSSPHMFLNEIASLCTKSLQQELGETFLESKSLVEKSLSYWEHVGLIERVFCGGQEHISFVHKTFGEFTAARYLEYIELSKAKKLILENIENVDWESVLDYVSEREIRDSVAEIVIFRATDSDTTSRLTDLGLRVLARPGIKLEPDALSAFLVRIFSIAQAEDRQEAYRIGVSLTTLDLSHVPEVAKGAKLLTNSQFEWSKLIGWAVLTSHFKDELDRAELENAMFHYIALGKDEGFFNKRIHDGSIKGLRNWLLRDEPDKKVYTSFLGNALETTLENKTVDQQDTQLAAVSGLTDILSVRFVNRLEQFLLKINRKDALSMFWSENNRKVTQDVYHGISEFGTGVSLLFKDAIANAFVNKAVSKPTRSGLKQLGAFLKLAEVLDDPASNMKSWTKVKDFRSVHVIIRAAAEVYGLSFERLAGEVLHFYNEGNPDMEFGEKLNPTDLVPKVDVNKVNWERAKDVEISNTILEESIYHPVHWLRYLSANILHHRIENPERVAVCARLLQNGCGTTLDLAAQLARILPDHRGYDLILASLREPHCSGSHYLFCQLAEDEFPIDRSHKDVVEQGLFSSFEETAGSAAIWCGAGSDRSEKWLERLLRKAFKYWMANEQPNSKNILLSPTDAIYKTLKLFGGFEFNQLVVLATDTRRNISGNAVQDLIEYVSDSVAHRYKLVEEISTKRFHPSQCISFLDSKIPYSKEDLTKLSLLVNDIDPAYRQIATLILSHPNMDEIKAIQLAISRKDDEDGNVRDAIFRYLDSVELAPNSSRNGQNNT